MAGFPLIEQRCEGARPTHVMVFGERNCGTNHANELLCRNIPALARSPGDRIAKFGFPFGWKHAFPQMISAPPETLAVVMVRHPETWLRSMHTRPWHAAPALRGRTFSEFIRAEWQAVIDEQNFGVLRKDIRWMTELQWDRHPMTGKRYRNICELRRVKTMGFLTLMERFSNCVIARQEDVTDTPEAFVDAVAQDFGLDRTSEFVPVLSRRGRNKEGQFRPASYEPLTQEDHDFVWQELDSALEVRLGYQPRGILAP